MRPRRAAWPGELRPSASWGLGEFSRRLEHQADPIHHRALHVDRRRFECGGECDLGFAPDSQVAEALRVLDLVVRRLDAAADGVALLERLGGIINL